MFSHGSATAQPQSQETRSESINSVVSTKISLNWLDFTGKSAPPSARGAMAAFKQMDTANNPNAGAAPKPK